MSCHDMPCMRSSNATTTPECLLTVDVALLTMRCRHKGHPYHSSHNAHAHAHAHVACNARVLIMLYIGVDTRAIHTILHTMHMHMRMLHAMHEYLLCFSASSSNLWRIVSSISSQRKKWAWRCTRRTGTGSGLLPAVSSGLFVCSACELKLSYITNLSRAGLLQLLQSKMCICTTAAEALL